MTDSADHTALLAEAHSWPNPDGATPAAAPADLIARLAEALSEAVTATSGDGPVFTGSPADWWEQATIITEQEAAERLEGSWYIAADTRQGEKVGSYRLSPAARHSNDARLHSLARRIARGETTSDSPSTTVRRLIFVPITPPAWLSSALIIADTAAGSTQRTLWRRTNTKWLQVFNARQSASDRTMAGLNPVPASITEGS